MRNGGELSDLEYLPMKTENAEYLQNAATYTPLISSGPLHDTIVDRNKSKIIRNGGELSDLEYLPSITEYIKYLQNADTRASRLFGPIKQNYIRFK